MRKLLILVIGLLALPQAASAVITFTQLDDDVFVISHRVKGIGLRGKAMKLVYKKAASVCVAAGYSHFKILDQESNTGQQYQAANASIQAQYFLEDSDGRIECKRNADVKYVEQATNKLREKGYKPPMREVDETKATDVAAEGADEPGTKPCTVEQITAMVKAGLKADQIKAACPD